MTGRLLWDIMFPERREMWFLWQSFFVFWILEAMPEKKRILLTDQEIYGKMDTRRRRT